MKLINVLALGTMEAEFRQYKDQVFPKGVPPSVENELRRAFMAGGMVSYLEALKASELPGQQAMEALNRLAVELAEHTQALIKKEV